ncbi:MAG: hypothetical protein RL701_7353 [Pseudomonadota bacterium]
MPARSTHCTAGARTLAHDALLVRRRPSREEAALLRSRLRRLFALSTSGHVDLGAEVRWAGARSARLVARYAPLE